jgi:endonuclease YncB( thermonuclease family)
MVETSPNRGWMVDPQELKPCDMRSHPKAPTGSRIAALLLDSLIAFPGFLLYILPGIGLIAFKDSLTYRQSVGRRVTGIRLILVATGSEPTASQKFARNLTALLLRTFTFGAYSLAELVVHLARNDGRCVTDLMFGSTVISVDAQDAQVQHSESPRPKDRSEEDRPQNFLSNSNRPGPNFIRVGLGVFTGLTVVSLVMHALRTPQESQSRSIAPVATQTSTRQPANEWQGVITDVIDGDTVLIYREPHQFSLRLAGIDAPELTQECGAESKAYLTKLSKKQAVNVSEVGKKVEGRVVGVVRLMDGTVINLRMVQEGYAWWRPNAEVDNLVLSRAERSAVSSKVGIWSFPWEHISPWRFRLTAGESQHVVDEVEGLRSAVSEVDNWLRSHPALATDANIRAILQGLEGGRSFAEATAVIERNAATYQPIQPTSSGSLPRPWTAGNGSFYGQPNAEGRPKTVYVQEYYRSDGTKVRSHFRAPPQEK